VQPDEQAPGGGTRTLLALVVIVVLVVIGAVVLARSPSGKSSGSPAASTTSSTTIRPHSTGPATPTTSTTLVAPAQVKVQVLNGANPAQPIASAWSNKLHTTYGYDTLPGDNATTTVQTSAIYVMTSGYIGEANRLATQVSPTTPPTVYSTVPSTAPIPASVKNKANLVLVIGADLANKA
jgi:hypothetical protein